MPFVFYDISRSVAFGRALALGDCIAEPNSRVTARDARPFLKITGDKMSVACAAPAKTRQLNPSRDQLIVSHLPLVRSIAKRVRNGVPVSIVFDDLVQAGVIGLIDAVDRYRPEMNVRFDLYAKFRIRGAILDTLRQLDTVSRDARKRAKEIQRASDRCAQAVGRTPTESEVSAELGLGHRELFEVKRDLAASGVLVTPWHTVELHTGEFPEPTERMSSDPYVRCANAGVGKVLALAIGTLPPRYQRVVQMYYIEEKTMKDIGAELEVNESRVSQIHKAALAKLRHEMRRLGLPSIDRLLEEVP